MTTSSTAVPFVSTLNSDDEGANNIPAIIVFSHLRWNFVWQRPQQFLSRFATSTPVLFIEEPIYNLPPGELTSLTIQEPQKNITVLTPHTAPDVSREQLHEDLRALTRAQIAKHRSANAFSKPILWYYNPMDRAWSINHFNAHTVVYDCMDELSLFAGAPRDLVEEEQRLLRRADIVFAGGKDLAARKSAQHANVHFFGCGVEFEHFGQAQQDGPLPADIQDLPAPRIGWFGVIDERMDYGLLQEAAAMRPDWQFLLVGPVVKVDPNALPKAPNIHWLGQRDYAELPAYCRGFDVCMMPFALNDATRFINPTKALEYLATGRPVVSTPVQDVVAQYTDSILIADDATSFVGLIDQALQTPDHARIARGIQRAQACSWDATVNRMRELMLSAPPCEKKF